MKCANHYKRIVILGAAGFIGINLANALARQDGELICFDRVHSPQWPEKAKAVIGDFTELPAELLESMSDAIVFHLISLSRPLPDTAHAVKEIDLDLISTLHYLEATKGRSLRWIFLSSGGTVYGNQESERIVETCKNEPICSYGLVKIAIEKYFALYRRLYGTDYVIARLANPYGPWQNPLRGQGIIAALTYKALTNEMVEIWGDGNNVRDYIYIDDAIQGILAIAKSDSSGEIYNIGTATGHSINQIIAIICNTLQLKLRFIHVTGRPVDVERNVLDISKITAYTQWRPLTTIESGIAATADWLGDKLESFEPK